MSAQSLVFCSLILFVGNLALVFPLPAAVEVVTPVPTQLNIVEEANKLPDVNIVPIRNPVEANNKANETNQDTNDDDLDSQKSPDQLDNVASASSIEPGTVYASGMVTPEVFQQYLNQYGAAAAYAPFAGAYPAPVAAAPGLYPYPGPIVVQTGYEGYLVPTTTATTTGVVSTNVVDNSWSNPLQVFFNNLIPTILMSTLFRIAAVVISAIGIIFFGSAITSSLCRVTSLCQIPNKALEYLRSGDVDGVGQLVAEEITPERVRRATQFVHNAIRKYRQLQKPTNKSD